MNRALFLILICLGGAAILVGLGVWQVQRLTWKEGIIAEIDAQMMAAPVALPAAPDRKADAYLPVSVTGMLGDRVLRVLVSQKDVGAGYRLISPLVTDQGRIMVDRGFIATDDAVPSAPDTAASFTGNLQWPQETDSFTPAPDIDNNIWFARDVDAMAAALDTQPVLVVARNASFDDGAVTTLPVDTARIPNDHLQYAITWFSLAALWLAMSLYFLRRRAKFES